MSTYTKKSVVVQGDTLVIKDHLDTTTIVPLSQVEEAIEHDWQVTAGARYHERQTKNS